MSYEEIKGEKHFCYNGVPIDRCFHTIDEYNNFIENFLCLITRPDSGYDGMVNEGVNDTGAKLMFNPMETSLSDIVSTNTVYNNKVNEYFSKYF